MKTAKMQKKNKAIRTKQDGFAAIIVTLIIMSILTLITIGFVQIVSREQRSTLDRQLSTQAFYAAETAINDAARILASNPSIEAKDECSVDPADGWSPNLGEGVEYTCVLIDPTPPSVEFDSVGQQHPKAMRLYGIDDAGNNEAIDRLQIYWQSDPYPEAPTLTGGSNFPEAFTAPVAAPVLRVSLTPLHQLSRQQLIENTMTFFLRPSSSSGETTRSFESTPADQGENIAVQCDTSNTTDPKICEFQLTGLESGAGAGTSGYLMTLRSVYSNASVVLTAQNSSGEALRFLGNQAIVDATGRANDVLRRIQVRLPLQQTFEYPGFALEAASGVCKPYGVLGSGDGRVSGSHQGDCSL